MFLIVLVSLAVLAIMMTVGGAAGIVLQSNTRVSDADHKVYQIAVGPTGVPLMSFMDWDGSWLTSPYFWIRFLRKVPRTWSVVVVEAWNGRDPRTPVRGDRE